MESDQSAKRLQQAYESLDYELVETHKNLTVPSSAPARFNYASSPSVTDAVEIENRLNRADFVLMDVHAQNGEAWHEFSVSATVFGPEAADRGKMTLSTGGVTILQDRERRPSREFFNTLVETAEDVLEADLEWAGDTDG